MPIRLGKVIQAIPRILLLVGRETGPWVWRDICSVVESDWFLQLQHLPFPSPGTFLRATSTCVQPQPHQPTRMFITKLFRNSTELRKHSKRSTEKSVSKRIRKRKGQSRSIPRAHVPVQLITHRRQNGRTNYMKLPMAGDHSY